MVARLERKAPPVFARLRIVRNVNLDMDALARPARDRLRPGERDDRVGQGAAFRRDEPVAADVDAGRAARSGPGDGQGGRDVDRAVADHDLEGDKLIPRRVQSDAILPRVPEVVGREVAVGRGGEDRTPDGIDLVELVDDRDLGPAEAG